MFALRHLVNVLVNHDLFFRYAADRFHSDGAPGIPESIITFHEKGFNLPISKYVLCSDQESATWVVHHAAHQAQGLLQLGLP